MKGRRKEIMEHVIPSEEKKNERPMEGGPGLLRALLLISTALCIAFCSRSADTASKPAERERPAVTAVGTVASDIVAVTIRTGRVEYGRQGPYQQEKGDNISRADNGNFWILRKGKAIGSLISKEAKIMTFDRVVGERPDPLLLDSPDNYSVTSADDASYSAGAGPQAVFRKSKPTDLACMGATFDAPVEHTLYLKLPHSLKIGKQYTIKFAQAGVDDQTFLYDPRLIRSEAVHVSHIGFRPDDPSKVAFFSLWMGNGGGLTCKEGTPFVLIDDKSNTVSFEGRVTLAKAVSEKNEDSYGKNFSGVNVYTMDFSALRKTGTYRLCVEGVGCSYPFDIQADVWRKAFYVSVRGLYHQRSGIEIGPPYTTLRRPRGFHPDDGVKVYASTAGLMETSNGIMGDVDVFTKLMQGRTGEIVPNAWGGYCDAGDWDRRIQHLLASRLLLELFELFPGYFARFDLNIPGSKDLPDLIREALWDIDFYGRLQTEEGGVRGGIESEAHPRYGEASWQQSQIVMAYAPDVWSTYQYAASAARAAFVLGHRDTQLSRTYLESAARAMDWAEEALKNMANPPFQVRDVRNLAAAEMFRATGKKMWHTIFLETSVLTRGNTLPPAPQGSDQGEAEWIYARTGAPGVDKALKARCTDAVIKEADKRIRAQGLAGFRWMKDPWRPAFAGVFTVPDAVPVIRAYELTGREAYLRAVILACQTGLGANPLNICYTTGLGWKSPLHPFHIDSRVTNQPPPPGITVLGPLDVQFLGGFDSAFHKIAGNFCFPRVNEWPVIETYWDVYWYALMCEYTIQNTIAPNAYIWGYLAARKKGRG
jgi:endoglucanase